jgi:hypothetical protein
VKRHQIHRRNGAPVNVVAGRHRFADGAFAGHQLFQAGADQLLVDLEDLGGLADQVRLGQVAVPVVGGLRQGVLQACLDPLRAVAGDPDRLGDGVGGLESDTPDL